MVIISYRKDSVILLDSDGLPISPVIPWNPW
jgi:hypothetical protein